MMEGEYAAASLISRLSEGTSPFRLFCCLPSTFKAPAPGAG